MLNQNQNGLARMGFAPQQQSQQPNLTGGLLDLIKAQIPIPGVNSIPNGVLGGGVGYGIGQLLNKNGRIGGLIGGGLGVLSDFQKMKNMVMY